jgi:hydrogenase maturation protease
VSPRILVAGVGNVFRGDDGFGVAVARRLAHEPLPPGVELRDYGVRGVHLAYELLDGYDLLVLVDAVTRGSPPGTLYVIEPDGPPMVRFAWCPLVQSPRARSSTSKSSP